MEEFYNYLRGQFSSLEEAEVFMRKWNREWNQRCVGYGDARLTIRAMAYHVSRVLEGCKDDPLDECFPDFLKTRYGAGLFWAT